MSQPRDYINTDMVGRIMSLEQRTKGLQGRISALEARLSCTTDNDSSSVKGISEDTEFIPAIDLSSLCPGPSSLDARLSALEQTVKKSDNRVSSYHIIPRAGDITGVVAGAILVVAGLLLYTGNIDMLKNPLMSMACGIFLIILSLAGKNRYSTKLTNSTE
jgi:hypothetical protein